jgi:hypothetical protein
MSKGRTLIGRVVNRAVGEAAMESASADASEANSIRAEIKVLKRQRAEIIEDLAFTLYHNATEEEDDDDYIPEEDGEEDSELRSPGSVAAYGDGWNEEETEEEWSGFDNEMERETG